MPDSARWLTKLAEVPFVTAGIPAISAALKTTPEDFKVEEIPAYAPSGEGEHLYVFFEKRGMNTPEAVHALARKMGARGDDAGWAGLKDRQAVTRQWASFHHPLTPSAADLALEGVHVLKVTRHGNKLRTGHLRGNRFTLRLRNVAPEHDAYVLEALARLRQVGVPNYYGSQRFGLRGRNLHDALRWIVDGERPPQKPFLRKLFVSSLQSAFFNLWLGERVSSGTLDTAIAGDLMRKEETGGMFDCTDPSIDTPRVTAWEISPTGPMFGSSMRTASLTEKELEDALQAAWGVTNEHFDRVKKFGEGTRRDARVRPDAFEMDREGTDLLLQFELPKGSYATVFMAELLKTRDLDLTDDA